MWRIKSWDEHYENSRSREVSEARWVPIPNQQDGDGYLALVSSENGAEQYGCFIALVLLASRCAPRGELRQSSGIPHTVETIARKSHMSASLVQSTLHRCMQPDVDWIEWVDDADDVDDGLFAEKPGPVAMPRRRQATAAAVPIQTPAGRDPRSGSGREESSSTSTTTARVGAGDEFPCTDGAWTPSRDLIESLRQKHPALDIEAQIRLARAKTSQIPELRKPMVRMPRFLWNWMRVAQADLDAGGPSRRHDGDKPAAAPRTTRAGRVLEMLEKSK